MLSNRDNWVVDKATGFLAPVTSYVNGQPLMGVDQKVKFLEIFRDTYNLSAAAKAVGVATRTIHDHLNFDAGFSREYEEAIAALTDESQSALVSLMRKGNVAAMFGILKRYDPRWRDRAIPDGEEEKAKKLKKVLDAMTFDVPEAK